VPVVQAGLRDVPVTTAARVHGIVQVWAHPSDADRAVLAAAGITLLDYLPEMAWLAAFPPEYLAGAALPAPASRLLRALLPLQANDKLEPALREHGLAAWALAPDGNARVSVQFFPDVTAVERARILARYGAQSLGGQLVSVLRSSLLLLLAEDAVQWIENGPPPVGAANSGARSATGVTTVQASDATLIGTGVKVGIWDGGAVYAHGDFGSRLTVVEAGTANSHATHVAGSIGGSGAGDANAKGMAPGATLYSYDFNGTVPSEMASAITTYGIALSNNSWGYSLADPPTAAQCAALRGVYNSETRSFDQLVRGEYSAGVAAISLLFAAGNDRANSWPLCQTTTAPYANYGTILGPGSTAKNTIVVGAVCDSSASLYASCINGSAAVVGGGADLMSTFSDWGPMLDGRIKPDVVAPGVEIWSTNVGGAYTNMQGTSMATPVTTGVATLLYQKWRALNSNVDPPPATIKALLIQTADDLSSSTLSFLKTGPDYASGYGRINAVAAVAAISGSLVTRDQVANGAQDIFSFTLASGAPALKITLVWDDPAATANAATTLVNNLDLQLVGPDGTVYRPYVLNPASPSAAATTGIDSINNVEQVYVAAPGAGAWQAKVTGSSVPSGPQNYSLAGSVRLSISAATGVVFTESGGSTAVDKGGTTDTYTVKLASEPSGNVVVTVGENSQLSTSPKVLTFTTANYATAQTVTVSAVNDNRYEVSHTATLTHSVSSSDTNYNGLSSTALPVTITSPTPGTGRVAILESGGTTLVGEGDATDTYTLVLSEAPTSTLLIRVGDGLPDLAEHQVLFTTKLTTTASNTATLEFDSSNFSVPQTVTVMAVNDSYGEGRHSAVITGLIISTSSANYLSVQVPSFTAVIEDNDQTLVLTQSAGSTDVAEGGLTDSYTVNLSLQPTGTVVVYAGGGQASGRAEQLTFLPASLTFSNTNYAVPQVVTVTALDDSTVEGYHTGVITHSVSPSAGFNNLASVASTRITVNIDDNDSNVAIVETGTSTHTVRFAETLPSIALQYGIVLETLLKSNPGVSAELLKIGDVLQLPTNNTTRTVVREGGGITDTYTVFLLTAPTGNVSVTLGDGMYALQITPSGTDPGYSHDVTFTTAGTTTATSTVTLTFTPANYSTPQTVTVLALDDALKEGVEKVSITHHVRSVSNTGRTNVVIDSRYNETVANRVIVTVLDNDVGIATMGADFDGDGKTDYAIFRPGTAQYFVRKSLDSSAEVLTWGDAAQADRPVPADYDGDGKSDYAVYRPGTAQFLVRKSSSGIAEVVTWGIAGGGDRPAVADFDGDGRVDYAIYRSTTAQFIVKNSADNSATDFTWGVANGSDTPVVGDYDGDGKADYAVYRRPSAQWFIKQSSNGSVVVTAWGMARSADIPVPGDYDGDGKIDLAIFRPETAEFFVRQSSNVIVAVTRWGIAGGGDVPVPGDYDGDGKMDKAIFRPSTAAFIVQKSSTLTAIDPPTTWGVAGGFDYPLPVPDPNSDGTVYGFIGQ